MRMLLAVEQPACVRPLNCSNATLTQGHGSDDNSSTKIQHRLKFKDKKSFSFFKHQIFNKEFVEWIFTCVCVLYLCSLTAVSSPQSLT